MNNVRNFFNLTRFMVSITALMAFIGLFSVSVFAEENGYQFNKIIQLTNEKENRSSWEQLLTDPSNKQQYFIINAIGQMHLIDDMNKTHIVLDLSADQKQSFIKLTAIEFHPNFSLRDQPGYGTFYTAHLEVLDHNSKTKRLKERSEALTLNFDAVITEWQFSSASHIKVDLKTKREVIRIAVPEKNMTIKQISFSPYTKSWNEGFGLLYVALNGDDKWQNPLYSGVLLRINPAKFGLRSFTVPSSNPYLKNNKIKDEIYLLGAHNIKQFIWPDKNSENILISHQYANKILLSLTGPRNDWRESTPTGVVYQSEYLISDMLTYHGRSLTHLRNKLLLLSKKDQRWLVESLSIKSSMNQATLANKKPQAEWQFTDLQFTKGSEISFSTDRDGEILVFNKSAGMMFQISPTNADVKMTVNNDVVTNETQRGSSSGFFPYFIVLIVIGGGYYWLKRNRFSAKSVVRKQFAHMELSESQLQIGLYHRHQSSTDTIIDIADIVSCESRLNEQALNLINYEVGHGFTHDKEQDLRNVFAKEKVDKMIDGRIRHVSLFITDAHGKTYTVCLYMRKGSDRITKKTYSVVIDDLIDWCWLIASKINANETEKRKKKSIVSTVTEESSAVQVPLHNQAEAIRAVTHEAVKAPQNIKEAPLEQEAVVTNKIVEKSVEAPLTENTINTELVNALEKLVTLKQQGFLTQEEFIKAKENLMQSLFDKS